jgi:UDP:flavonoid glycosyltransferase YjiC (YdhE family)
VVAAGLRLVRRSSTTTIRNAVLQVLRERTFAENARRMAEHIAAEQHLTSPVIEVKAMLAATSAGPQGA